MRNTAIILAACFMLCLTLPAAQASRLRNYNYPGGIVRQTVPCDSQIYYRHNQVLVTKIRNSCIAIIGIPLNTKITTQKLYIVNNDKVDHKIFKIRYKKYLVSRIKIRKKNYKTISKTNRNRIKKESRQKSILLSTWTPQLYTNLNFSWPVKGRISTKFGATRYVNNKLSWRHSGIDIAMRTGTPIKAPAAGYILETIRYFLGGNTIIINHGMGLISIYCHLSKTIVHPNEYINKGQIIGYLGSTGFSTGPHLHWEVHLNTVAVNPRLFIKSK